VPLSRQARFNWWIAVVIAALAAPLWLLFGGWTTEMRLIASIHQIIVLTVMLWLIESAPIDAIKLPRVVSALVLVVGAAWMFAVGTEFWVPRTGLLVRAAVLGASVVLFILASPKSKHEPSPWVIAFMPWHPMIWTPPSDWLDLDQFWLGVSLYLCVAFFPLLYFVPVSSRVRVVSWLLVASAFVGFAVVSAVRAPTPFTLTPERVELMNQTLRDMLNDPDLSESDREEIESLLRKNFDK